MDKNLLIVGIDPGTTLGYAAIDFEENIIKIHSEKNLDLNSLISELIKLGKPLIVTSDKQYNPDFVNKLAVKLGARIITPDYDLKVSEKREITKDFKTKNQHEIDALASAFFALKKISPLFKKINVFVEHYKKDNIKQQLIEFVIGKELNIRDAAEIIEEPEKQEIKIIKEVVEKKKLREKDFLTLYRKFKNAMKESKLLKDQNKKLKEQLTAVRKDYEYMFKRINRSQRDKKMQSLLSFKEKRINFFYKQLREKQHHTNIMQNEITTLLYFLSNINSSILLKKLDNLGFEEFQKKNKILNIKEGDILLVRDADIVSDNTIKEIHDNVHVIFYRKPISKKQESKLPFIFINANNADIEETEYFGIIAKEEFEKIKNKKSLLSKIVQDYKKEALD